LIGSDLVMLQQRIAFRRDDRRLIGRVTAQREESGGQ